MTDLTVAGVGETRERTPTRRGTTSWSWVRWVTLGMCAVISVAAVFVGVQPASMESLEAALREGRVAHVEAIGSIETWQAQGYRPEGSVTVRLRWRDGLQHYQGELRQYTSAREMSRDPVDDPSPGQSSTGIIGSLDRYLQQSSPSVTVTHREFDESSVSFEGTFYTVAGWWALLPLLAALGFLVTLVNGPEPRFATRWAWFWLSISPLGVLVVPAYLIGGAEGARAGRGRLTGGWAFLLLIFVLGNITYQA